MPISQKTGVIFTPEMESDYIQPIHWNSPIQKLAGKKNESIQLCCCGRYPSEAISPKILFHIVLEHYCEAVWWWWWRIYNHDGNNLVFSSGIGLVRHWLADWITGRSLTVSFASGEERLTRSQPTNQPTDDGDWRRQHGNPTGNSNFMLERLKVKDLLQLRDHGRYPSNGK